MKISYIIPAFNAAKFIKRCVDSIVNQQSGEDYEIVIVNDGSADNTIEIIKQLASTNDKIIVIDKENHGVSAARNDALDIVSGDYVMFVDADDFIMDTYSNALNEVEIDNSDDLIIFGSDRLSKNGNLSKWNYKSKRYVGSEILNLLIDMDALPAGTPTAKIFKSSILKANHIRFTSGQKLFEDACFVYRYLMHCRSVKVSDVSIYFYDTCGSVSSGFYGDVFFRDYTEYVNCQKKLIDNLSKKGVNLTTTNRVAEAMAERNSFQHVATIYKLYRSSSSGKREWLDRCLYYANTTDPEWYKYRTVGLPKYVAQLRNHPMILHLILSAIFKIERISNSIR